jgi:tetratricopeptide (TPR) repeat protein
MRNKQRSLLLTIRARRNEIRMTGKCVLSLLVFTFFILLLAASCNERKDAVLTCDYLSRNYIEVIRQYASREEKSILISRLNETITKYNGCKDAYALRADLYTQLDSLTIACEDYYKLYSIDTNNIYALYFIGMCNEQDSNFESAVSFYDKAMQKKTDHNGLIIDFNPGAQGIFNKRSYDVESKRIVFRRGLGNYYRGFVKQSYQDFSYSILQGFNTGASYFYRGLIYLSLDSLQKACREFEMARSSGYVDYDKYFEKYCNVRP